MRKFSLFLLLATSAMPALAQRGDDDDRQSRRASQSDQSESRAERAERPQRAERSERREAREQPQVQVERQVRTEGSRSERMQRYQQQVQQQEVQQQQVQQQQVQQLGNGSRSERIQRYQQQVEQQQAQGQSSRAERMEQWRRRQVDADPSGGGLVQRDRRVRAIPTTRPEAGQVGPVRTDIGRDGRDGRDGHRYNRDGRRYDRDDRNRWANHWRNDRRYDWRRYRDRNRSIFSLGFYFDPFGFNYRRFGIGSYLYSGYYQSNYWISDPWQYRLPPAYGPYRWVRYHNDAVMIDTWSGEVVDVIYGFFW